MPKHVFFDLDGTLTPSRSLMRTTDAELFEKLCGKVDVLVVTGGAQAQIEKQIPMPAKDRYYMLSQQGNYAINKDGTELWHETVSPEQEAKGREFAMMLTKEENPDAAGRDDIFENRGSQLASSNIGFHEKNEIKYAYDPDQSKRRAQLARHPKEIEALRSVGIEVMPAGTTTFDFILTGKHKGFNIARLLKLKGWSADECVYIGDALFPGGNDYSVVGVIPTKAVTGPIETFEFISKML